MVYKLEISKDCSSNERVRIKEFKIKSQKGYAYEKTEKPGRNQVDRYPYVGFCYSAILIFHDIFGKGRTSSVDSRTQFCDKSNS